MMRCVAWAALAVGASRTVQTEGSVASKVQPSVRWPSVRSPSIGSVHRSRVVASEAVASEAPAAQLSTPEAAKLFGRLAEKTLYLDAAVQACCHSACSDCEWRLPDGGYRWDIMKSTVPKWIPCYVQRDFEDERGCHTPAWAEALFKDDAAISRADFDARLRGMAFDSAAMGPKGKTDAELTPAALDEMWAWLGGGETLTAEAMAERLQAMSLAEDKQGAIGEGPDALVWKEFAKGLGAAPFERF